VDIEVWSVGKVKFTADPEFQEPMIREAIDQRGDVAGVIIDYTDSDRDRITHDEYARVTGDVPDLVLFEGWLTGDRKAPPPAGVPGPATAATATPSQADVPLDAALAGRHAIWNTDLSRLAAHPLGPQIIRFMHATQEHDSAVRKVGLHYQLEVDRLHDVYRAAQDLARAVAAQQSQPVPEVAAVTAPAISAGPAYGEDADHYDPGDYADDDGERDTARRMDALDEAARLEAGL
jgi:hypothetical protein